MSTHEETPRSVPPRDIDWSTRPGAGWMEFHAARDAYRRRLRADADFAGLARVWVAPEIGQGRRKNVTRPPLSARRGGSR
jgi:hypothetical protein